MMKVGREFWWAQRFKFWHEEVLHWKWEVCLQKCIMGIGIDHKGRGLGVRLGLNYLYTVVGNSLRINRIWK